MLIIFPFLIQRQQGKKMNDKYNNLLCNYKSEKKNDMSLQMKGKKYNNTSIIKILLWKLTQKIGKKIIVFELS